MRAGSICPVLIGSAEQGNGVGRLLKAIRHEAPEHRGDPRRASALAEGDDAIVQVMKTLHTTHGGKLSVARVLSRSVADGAELMGPDGRGRAGVRHLPPDRARTRRSATRRRRARRSALGKLDGAQDRR